MEKGENMKLSSLSKALKLLKSFNEKSSIDLESCGSNERVFATFSRSSKRFWNVGGDLVVVEAVDLGGLLVVSNSPACDACDAC
jgi:hypothetical protein